MSFSQLCNKIFGDTTALYHVTDHVDAQPVNPYKEGSIEFLLFSKNWIDAVQWHLEDIIRDPEINPTEALVIKRRIDKSNQDRTDLVEYIDGFFMNKFHDVKAQAGAGLNTETPAWAVDRLSILALKIYHMEQETLRQNASPEHISACSQKLNVLLIQRTDLSSAIDELLSDIESGKKIMKLYKQMKMYNDPSLNPVLYKTGK
jgi:antitoxin component HigA of HigAB toxin-antitoxin module